MVTLDRGFRTPGDIDIWDKGSTGAVGTANMREIRKRVGNHVDKFINDYRAAIPKK
jgi:arginine/ornithine N-succinyltransferase beta subunit